MARYLFCQNASDARMCKSLYGRSKKFLGVAVERSSLGSISQLSRTVANIFGADLFDKPQLPNEPQDETLLVLFID